MDVMMKAFEREIGRCRRYIKYLYERRLTTEQRRDVVKRFARHLRACERSGIQLDAAFLDELIFDLGRGYEV